MQRQLFGELLLAQGEVSELRRAIKRLESGKPMSATLEAKYADCVRETEAQNVLRQVAAHVRGHARASQDSERYVWLHLEEMVARRVEVQIRAVGDALAWRVLGFDRRYIHALSRNDRTGPMTCGRRGTPDPENIVDLEDGTTALLPATKVGLDYELGLATQLFTEKGTFALLNDLTNSIRIGDLTEIEGTRIVLHQVKVPGRQPDPDQTRCGQQAIDAINDGAHLPGAPHTRIQTSQVVVQQHLRRFGQLIRKADSDGFSAAILEPGCVASILSLALPAERRGKRFPGNTLQEAA